MMMRKESTVKYQIPRYTNLSRQWTVNPEERENREYYESVSGQILKRFYNGCEGKSNEFRNK